MTNDPVEALSLWLLFAERPTPPASPLVVHPPDPVDPQSLSNALRQIWDWPDAESEAARARFAVLVTDRRRKDVPRQERWPGFCGEVLQLVESTPGCVAIHAPLCQRLIDPAAFVAGQAPGGDLLHGAVNVRIYDVEDHGPGVRLMDTLGLFALGLPDLQCVFRGLDPGEVAALMWDYSYYLYEKGDVIGDGDVIRGLRDGEHWTAGKQWSLTDPRRVVLDLYPGPEFGPNEGEPGE
jgi:hypothetical protein